MSGFIPAACVTLLAVITAIDASADTLAERLGYPPDARLLIIHADDLGMSQSTNQACMETLEMGIVTSGSVMVPCPWFSEIAEFAVENPELCIGLHLTHTAEWRHYRWGPVAGREIVPGLVDAMGYLFRGVASVAQSASPQEIEAETRAQIELALAHGMRPTHLDSHMGVLYSRPDYLQVALNLSEEYNIPFMMFNPTPMMIARAGGRFPFELSEELRDRGVPLLDGLPSLQDTPAERAAEGYRELIRDLEPGVWLLILHPAKDTPELRSITGSWRMRDAEYRIFTDPAMRDYIEEQGVHLIAWRDLLPLWENRTRLSE